MFLFYLDLELFAQIKRPGFYKTTFINNSRSKKNKKSPTHTFVEITK